MGNASGKRDTDNPYTSEELRMLESAYKNASGGALEKLTQDRLVVSWGLLWGCWLCVRANRAKAKNQCILQAPSWGSGSQVQGRPETELPSEMQRNHPDSQSHGIA